MTGGRRRDAVLRGLARGEALEVVACELAVTAADLSAWRDAFLEAGEARLKSRQRDGRDETIGRLRTREGELTTDAELLGAKVERLEGGAPSAGRRPARWAPSSRPPRAAATARPGSAGSGASRARASTAAAGRRSRRPRRGAGRGLWA